MFEDAGSLEVSCYLELTTDQVDKLDELVYAHKKQTGKRVKRNGIGDHSKTGAKRVLGPNDMHLLVE